jgi:hypothetical protein
MMLFNGRSVETDLPYLFIAQIRPNNISGAAGADTDLEERRLS